MKETCGGVNTWLKAGNTEVKSNSEFLLSICKRNETTILILFTPVHNVTSSNLNNLFNHSGFLKPIIVCFVAKHF